MTNNSYRILIADDDSDDRYMMHQSFKEIGWNDEIKLFDSGMQLIAYLDSLTGSGYPRLIVLDFNMPGMNAAEIMHHLKRHDKYKDIVVAVYSVDMSDLLKQKLLSIGVNSCYKKFYRQADAVELAQSFKLLSESVFTS